MRPRDAEVIDAHTHLGLDEDGRSLTLEQLLAQLDAAGARRACVFPLHDPERKPAYSVPNDRVLAWAGESRGAADPVLPARPGRRTAAPRASAAWRRARAASSFTPARRTSCSTARSSTTCSGSPKQAAVPILIHAGRGLPPLAEGLVDLALRHPGTVLILAHGAICDQGILTSRAGRPSGRALRHLVLLPDRRDRAVRARARGADRVRVRSALRTARDHALHGAAGGRKARPRRAGDARDARGHDGRIVRRRASWHP